MSPYDIGLTRAQYEAWQETRSFARYERYFIQCQKEGKTPLLYEAWVALPERGLEKYRENLLKNIRKSYHDSSARKHEPQQEALPVVAKLVEGMWKMLGL
jgi:hypothetical protein